MPSLYVFFPIILQYLQPLEFDYEAYEQLTSDDECLLDTEGARPVPMRDSASPESSGSNSVQGDSPNHVYGATGMNDTTEN